MASTYAEIVVATVSRCHRDEYFVASEERARSQFVVWLIEKGLRCQSSDGEDPRQNFAQGIFGDAQQGAPIHQTAAGCSAGNNVVGVAAIAQLSLFVAHPQ
jgi:hypothetical protein